MIIYSILITIYAIVLMVIISRQRETIDKLDKDNNDIFKENLSLIAKLMKVKK